MSGKEQLRILEVAALPFPSRQGTQVLLDAICRGLAARGHEVHVLVYAHGAFPFRAPYRVHRLSDAPRFRSLRSGPDWRRIVLDAQLVVEVRRLAGKLRPDVIHLHNVEAAAATLLPPARPAAPCVYHAHNLMEHELPTYGSLGPVAVARSLGRQLDTVLPARADLTLAVSEPTRAGLIAAGADAARVVTVEPGVDPSDLAAGSLPPPPPGEQASSAPGRWNPAGPLCIAHLGNLDRYQGVRRILQAASHLRSTGVAVDFVAVTESEPDAVRKEAHRLEVPARFVLHGSLADALAAVADCHVAVLARHVPGGFPIKAIALLQAGVPVVAAPSAVAGLGLDDVVWLAENDEPPALAAACIAAATDPQAADRCARGRRLAAERFSSAAAAERIEAALRRIV